MPVQTNSPRYQRWVIQQQTTLLQFNNTAGTWNNTGAQLLKVDANSVTTTRNAPYSRFPVLTGLRSEVAGIRGRKGASWSIRGCPMIPSGVAGTKPDMDIILQNIFGQANAAPAGSGATATYTVTGSAVNVVTVTLPGSGYTPGAVDISFPGGTGATGDVIVAADGTIASVVVTNGGTGYTAGSATITAKTGNLYTFLDTGYLPFSLLGFTHGITTLTQRALWGCYVTRATFNFNGLFMTVDLDGFAGYVIDSTGFAAFDAQGKAGLTVYPLELVNPTTTGSPIAGFGNGYTMVIHSQDQELKVRAMSLSIETGFTPVADVYGSPYLAQVVGDVRRVSINLGDLLDDDSAALTDLKTQCDTDTSGSTTMSAQILAGNAAGSKMTFAINNIQGNAFNLRDNGPTVSFSMEASFAHTSNVNQVDDFQLCFS